MWWRYHRQISRASGHFLPLPTIFAGQGGRYCGVRTDLGFSSLGAGLLTLIEKYIGLIHDVADVDAARNALATIAGEFGFRSAQLLEFTEDLRISSSSLDTDPIRRAAGLEMAQQFGLAPTIEAIRAMLKRGVVVRLGAERVEPGHPYLPFWTKYDLIDVVAVPMTLGDEVAGLVTFSGTPELTPTQMRAIHTLSYSLFAQIRSLAGGSPRASQIPHLKPLTPREKEVMRLSATGRTSAEIARELGLSARTVNQHVENVADKLGTKNRTHTIAELMRYRMLA